MDIFIIIYFILGIILLIISIANKDNVFVFDICGEIFIGLSVSFITVFIVFFTTHQTIDVYQGRTTLEITYKDSIAVDSTVVFKK